MVQEIFDAADTDKGGKISFDEFVMAVNDATTSEGNLKKSHSLTSGLAEVVLKAQVAKLQSDAIGRFFLVTFLCCE